MINQIYQLISPKVFSVKYDDISFGDQVLVKPEYMAICHADQRYYLGQRDFQTLRKKLPMALIHECCGRVLHDPTGTFQPGQWVVPIPNVPGEDNGVVYENYSQGSGFLSSGRDGFLREVVALRPDRLVAFDGIDPQVAAITEFVSVGVHAVSRFLASAHPIRGKIGIWGDGSLAYVVANVLQAMCPEAKIAVIGLQRRKLAQFSFVHETILSEAIPEDFRVDHAFECCGGEGSYYAVEDIIRCINPQGNVMLMGVSENKVAINTRMVLEKGLTLMGCSRSGRADFQKAVEILSQKTYQRRMRLITFLDEPVKNISDLHRVFQNDLKTPFKTVFHWNV